jgi:hypothetical protein
MRTDNGKWNDITGTALLEYFMELSPAGINQQVCAGSNLNLSGTALSGATYAWTGPNSFSSSQQIPVIPNVNSVNAGVYTLTYSLGGCTAQASTLVEINSLPNNLGQNFPLPASLTTGLVLHYPMNGNANDASGGGNGGTLQGGVTAMADRFGNASSALQFNGTNGHITVPSGVYFNGGNFTVTAWVRKNANNNWSRLFDFSNGQANNNVLLAISSGTSGRPISQIYSGTTAGNQVSSPVTALTNNQWELLTYTWSNQAARIYINGILRGQGTQVNPVNVVRTINYIARSAWAGDAYANAGFDDFRIYNRVLTHNEIQSLLLHQPDNLSVVVIPSLICAGTSAQIALINTQPGVSYQLRLASTSTNVGAAQTGTGDTLFFNTGVLSATTDFNFQATQTSTTCGTVTTPNITVTVSPLPAAPVTTDDQVCNEGDMTLTASGAPAGGFYNWYTTPTGGTALAGVTGNSYSTGVIDETVSYYVSVTDANGCESARTLVTANVINPLNPPVDIITGLILHYKFDGNYADSSGNGYNATTNVSGSATYNFVNDRNSNPGSALYTVGSTVPGTNWLNAGNPAKVQQLTNQMSVSFWIRQTQTWFGPSGTDGQMPLINKWDGATGMWVGLRMQNPANMTNRVRWRINGATFLESNTNVPVGTWHHVVCTYNGAQLRIYQDGVLTGTLNYTGTIANTGVNLFVGRQANTVGEITYRGDWDEVKIYNRALNLSEVQTLHNNESVAFSNSPLCDGEDDLILTTFNFPGATYNWTGPNGFTSNVQNPPVITNADSATYNGLYTLLVTAQGCTSPPQNVNVVIYEIPLAPTTVNDTVCGSGNAVLTASGAPVGASYNWYTVATGGTPIAGQNGATLTITSVTSTTDRWVSIVRNRCEGPRTQVTAVYYTDVLTNLTVTGSTVCAGSATANVTVNGTEAGVNYQAFSGTTAVGSFVAGGGNIVIAVNTSSFSAGNYTITIKATRPGCGSVDLTNTATITVLALPTVNISADGPLSFCNGDDVNLTATSASSYAWSSGETTQTINVTTSGTYTVTITDINGCSNTSASVTTTNVPLPVPVISAGGPTTFCNGQNVTLIASGGTTYLWNTGSASTSIVVTAAGTYNFTAFNGSCSAISSDITVTVNPAPAVVANASVTTVCPGQPVTLTGTGAVSYSWDNGVTDGVAFNPAATTTYTVIGTDVNGCTATDNITVTVNPLPDASFTASSNDFCPGTTSILLSAVNTTATQYDWYESGNLVNGNGGSTYSISSTGSYTLTVIDANGCTNTSAPVVIGTGTPPVSVLSAANTSFCGGSGELITATFHSSANYTWYHNGIAVLGPVFEQNTFSANAAGTYYAEVTNASGCTGNSDTLVFSVIPLPTANISSNGTAYCPGDSLLLTAVFESGAMYEWQLNGLTVQGPSANNTMYVAQNGNYTVVVSNNGCTQTSNTISVSQLALPGNAGSISGMTAFCQGESDVYSISAVANATSYNWTINPAGAASISTGQGTNSVTVNTTNQNFTLTVTPQNTCGNGNSSSLNVTLEPSFICDGNVMFAANQTNVCVGTQIIYTNYTNNMMYPNTTIQWNFGAGATPATATGNGPHAVTYSTAGLKTVLLEYIDNFTSMVVDSELKTNYVNVSGVVSTSPISGNTSISCAAQNEIYSVINTPGSTYTWSVPAGAIIVSGQGTNSIVVDFNGTSGTVSVVETVSAGCSGATVSINVTITNGVTTSSITGNTLVDCSGSNEAYSVVNTTGSVYTWIVPAGAVIVSGQGTNNIVVNFNGNMGVVSVTETNSAGCTGSPVTVNVTCTNSTSEINLNEIKVYPNPADNYLVMELNLTEECTLIIYDYIGKAVLQNVISPAALHTLDVLYLVPGMYYGVVLHKDRPYANFRFVKD